MAQTATVPAPAPAEVGPNQPPAPDADVREELGGIGVLGLVQDDGRIEGEIEVVELDPRGFSFTKLATRPNTSMGWDRVEGEVTDMHAAHLAGVTVSEVRIISDSETPEGEGQHVRFSLLEKISSGKFVDFKEKVNNVEFASMGEYQGPVDGLIGRRLPEV